MKDDRTRREFLRDASVAGITLVVGGGIAAGCRKSDQEQLCPSGHKKVCTYWWDDQGGLYVEDEELYTKLYQIYQNLPGQVPPAGSSIKGIKVIFPEPGSPNNHINSLCTC